MDRIIITIEIGGIGTRRVNVRKDLHVSGLIDEIRNRFDLLQGRYALVLKGEASPLDSERTLEQHGITENAWLIFVEENERITPAQALIEAGTREPISASNQVYVQEERQGLVFEIAWQPAIIGRADQQNPSNNRLLAVNLAGLRGSESVSRHHACITEQDDQYFIESLNPRNPTYLNNRRIEQGERVVVQPGDRIQVGKITLLFNQRG